MNDTVASITQLDSLEEVESQKTSTRSALLQGINSKLDRVDKLTVQDVMIPRTDIIGLDMEGDQRTLLDTMVKEGFSRYPVYRGNRDKVTGMVHIRDAFEQFLKGEKLDLEAIQHDCLYVSPSISVLDLLLEMREKRIHLALVVDEFGGNDGLVTIEDLIEQIVGDIEDEHDTETEIVMVKENAAQLLVSARVKLDELEETIGCFQNAEDKREDVDTLGGLMYGMLGRIPKPGELIRHDSGLSFEIVEVDQRLIQTVRIHHTNHLIKSA